MLILQELGFALDVVDEKLCSYQTDNSGKPKFETRTIVNSLTNKELRHGFSVLTRCLIEQKTYICEVCNTSFLAKLPALTCSPKCRKIKSRKKENHSKNY